MREWYTEASAEPSTATPSAPPTWRMVLLTADPTPARSRGSVDSTELVAGGITLAIPAPCTKNSADTNAIEVSAWTSMNPVRATVTRAIPTVQTTFGPNLFTIAALRGANTIWARANG